MLIVTKNPVYCAHIKLLVLVSGLVFKLNVIHLPKLHASGVLAQSPRDFGWLKLPLRTKGLAWV